MKCSVCKKSVKKDWKFCANCGQKLVVKKDKLVEFLLCVIMVLFVTSFALLWYSMYINHDWKELLDQQINESAVFEKQLIKERFDCEQELVASYNEIGRITKTVSMIPEGLHNTSEAKIFRDDKGRLYINVDDTNESLNCQNCYWEKKNE